MVHLSSLYLFLHKKHVRTLFCVFILCFWCSMCNEFIIHKILNKICYALHLLCKLHHSESGDWRLNWHWYTQFIVPILYKNIVLYVNNIILSQDHKKLMFLTLLLGLFIILLKKENLLLLNQTFTFCYRLWVYKYVSFGRLCEVCSGLQVLL